MPDFMQQVTADVWSGSQSASVDGVFSELFERYSASCAWVAFTSFINLSKLCILDIERMRDIVVAICHWHYIQIVEPSPQKNLVSSLL